MNGLWLYERERRVNWVRCYTFYFELLIRHLERAIGKHICMQTCRHVLNIRNINYSILLNNSSVLF